MPKFFNTSRSHLCNPIFCYHHPAQSQGGRLTHNGLRPRPISSATILATCTDAQKPGPPPRTAPPRRRPRPLSSSSNGVEEAAALPPRRQLCGKPRSPFPRLDLSLSLSLRVSACSLTRRCCPGTRRCRPGPIRDDQPDHKARHGPASGKPFHDGKWEPLSFERFRS